MKIVVTGANGFVGRATCAALGASGHDVIALVRGGSKGMAHVGEQIVADDNFASLAVPTADVFILLAARVHVMRDVAADPMADYRRVNVEGSLNVARAARAAGAKRLVFVSSVKALGEGEPGRPWREIDEPAPSDPYGHTKLEAEQALSAFGATHGMDVVILRPPLVYGPGVKANFEQMMRAVEKGVPLPLGGIEARRSMVFVDNLADAIRFVATRPEPTNGVFHVSDGDDLSIAGMLRALANEFGRSARLLFVPASWLQLAGRITGRSGQVRRLTHPLRIDISRLRALGWTPPVPVMEGFKRTVAAYRTMRGESRS